MQVTVEREKHISGRFLWRRILKAPFERSGIRRSKLNKFAETDCSYSLQKLLQFEYAKSQSCLVEGDEPLERPNSQT